MPVSRARNSDTALGAVYTASSQRLSEESNHGAIELFVECQTIHTGRVLTNNGNGCRQRRAAWCKENKVVSARNNSLLRISREFAGNDSNIPKIGCLAVFLGAPEQDWNFDSSQSARSEPASES